MRLRNELVAPLQHAVTGSPRQMFCEQRGTSGFWTHSEQLWKSWLANLTRSICCNVKFYILLRGHWSWDPIQLRKVLSECRQQGIKSFLFCSENIKVLGRWWVSLENEAPPSLPPFLVQFSYSCDLKESCLSGLGYEWPVSLYGQRDTKPEKRGYKQDVSDFGVSHATRHPEQHKGLGTGDSSSDLLLMPPQKTSDSPLWSMALGKLTSPEKLLAGAHSDKKQPLDKTSSSQGSLAAAA